jgi:flagellar hook-associated protein 2
MSTSYDATADKFTFVSQKYGLASKMDFTGGSFLGSIGLVAGNTGLGQHVTVSTLAGANLPKGLEFDVGGTTTGARGTIDFNRGYADKLSQLFTTFQGTDGLLGQQLTALNKETTTLADQKTKIDARYAQIEMKYRLQFGALQSVLSSMKQTRASLSASFGQSTTTGG